MIEALAAKATDEALAERIQISCQVHPVVVMSCEVSTFATHSILSTGAGLSWSHIGITGVKNGSTATITMAVSGAFLLRGQS